MLTKYLYAAMRDARYAIPKDERSYNGEIPQRRWVYANAPTSEECRTSVAVTIEPWLLFRVHPHLKLPTIEVKNGKLFPENWNCRPCSISQRFKGRKS